MEVNGKVTFLHQAHSGHSGVAITFGKTANSPHFLMQFQLQQKTGTWLRTTGQVLLFSFDFQGLKET